MWPEGGIQVSKRGGEKELRLSPLGLLWMGPFSLRGSPFPHECVSPPRLTGSATGSASDAEGIHKPEDLPYFQCPGVEVRRGERKPTPNETQAV